MIILMSAKEAFALATATEQEMARDYYYENARMKLYLKIGERVEAGRSSLDVTELPTWLEDELWARGYEVFDHTHFLRISWEDAS